MPSASDTSFILCYVGFLVVIAGMMAFMLVGYLVIFIGIAMLIVGILIQIALHPSRKRENMKIQSIVNIVSVRKQVTISDISAETGLDREYIQEVIAKRLINGSLHGYLENDIFVRDTGARLRSVVDETD